MPGEGNNRGPASNGTHLRRSPLKAAAALMAAVDEHHPATAVHSHAVVKLAEAVAERMDLSGHERNEVVLVALLHDVGKVATPRRLLAHPGRLSPGDVRVLREHSAAGARMVADVSELAPLASAIRACHERWDGSGYPDGLAGEEIPLASRITFVCDAYDAMTSDRPYRSRLSPDEAADEVRRCAGSQFCPRGAAALLEVLEPVAPVLEPAVPALKPAVPALAAASAA